MRRFSLIFVIVVLHAARGNYKITHTITGTYEKYFAGLPPRVGKELERSRPEFSLPPMPRCSEDKHNAFYEDIYTEYVKDGEASKLIWVLI